MTKKTKKKVKYAVSDAQKGWATIAIGALALVALVAYNYEPVEADGYVQPSGFSMTASQETVNQFFALVRESLGLALSGKVTPAVEPQSDVFGAVSGPELFSETWTVNGVETKFVRRAFKTATSTPCAIQSPTNASSTLVRTEAKIVTSTSTATVWHIAKATTQYATTTLLRNAVSVGSGVKGIVLHAASTTDTALDSVDVFAPGQWLVYGASGFHPAGTAFLTGVCQAEFRTI